MRGGASIYTNILTNARSGIIDSTAKWRHTHTLVCTALLTCVLFRAAALEQSNRAVSSSAVSTPGCRDSEQQPRAQIGKTIPMAMGQPVIGQYLAQRGNAVAAMGPFDLYASDTDLPCKPFRLQT
eukprot:4072904-Amphidinium_carterae.1